VQDIPTPKRVIVEMSGPLDAEDLDRLARLQLAARQMGMSIALRDGCGRVADLLALCGLSEVLPVVDASGVDVERQAEPREEVGVDEEVDRRDRPV
jgi:hypothetical protein